MGEILLPILLLPVEARCELDREPDSFDNLLLITADALLGAIKGPCADPAIGLSATGPAISLCNFDNFFCSFLSSLSLLFVNDPEDLLSLALPLPLLVGVVSIVGVTGVKFDPLIFGVNCVMDKGGVEFAAFDEKLLLFSDRGGFCFTLGVSGVSESAKSGKLKPTTSFSVSLGVCSSAE